MAALFTHLSVLLMNPAISQLREEDGRLGRSVAATAKESVQLVFVEPCSEALPSQLRVRCEAIAFDADSTTLVAHRRPDLLLVNASLLATADAGDTAAMPTTLSSESSYLDRVGNMRAVFDALRGHDRQLPLIVMVPGNAQDGEWVMAAIEAGAAEVVSEAIPTSQLHEKIFLATQRRRLQKRPTIRTATSAGSPASSAESTLRTVIGASDTMLSVLCRMARFAAESVPVLVHGQPGTGKSLLALTLQRHAHPTGERPLIIDCGQFAAEMLDRLLFEDAAGRVQLRKDFNDQSLILENVDQACGRVQRRLLAAIRQREAELQQLQSVAPQTSPPTLVMTCSTTIDVDRPGTATGESTCGLISELLFELSGYAIELPPLRDRGSDVSKLIEHFIRTLTGTAPIDATGREHRITAEAKAALERYDWPGNVTQLRSVLASELRLGGGTIVLSERLLQLTGRRERNQPQSSLISPPESAPLASLNPHHSIQTNSQQDTSQSIAPEASRAWAQTVERLVANAANSDQPRALYGETIQEVEAGLISAVLEKTRGNLAQSARLLGITRVSLRRKIHSLGLSIPGRKSSS